MRKNLFDKVKKYMLMGGIATAMLFSLTACKNNDYDNSGSDMPAESSSGEEITYEKEIEIDNENGEFEASFGITGDGVEQIEESGD